MRVVELIEELKEFVELYGEDLELNRKLRKESINITLELLDMGYSQNNMLEEMNNKMREMIRDHKLLEG